MKQQLDHARCIILHFYNASLVVLSQRRLARTHGKGLEGLLRPLVWSDRVPRQARQKQWRVHNLAHITDCSLRVVPDEWVAGVTSTMDRVPIGLGRRAHYVLTAAIRRWSSNGCNVPGSTALGSLCCPRHQSNYRSMPLVGQLPV